VNLFTDDAEDYTAKSVSKGIDEICARVKRAYDDWVAAKSFIFLPTENIDEHHNIVKFFWKMVPKDGGPVESIGLDIFVLNDDGKIRALLSVHRAKSLVTKTTASAALYLRESPAGEPGGDSSLSDFFRIEANRACEPSNHICRRPKRLPL
jgi:hypothetical protein